MKTMNLAMMVVSVLLLAVLPAYAGNATDEKILAVHMSSSTDPQGQIWERMDITTSHTNNPVVGTFTLMVYVECRNDAGGTSYGQLSTPVNRTTGKRTFYIYTQGKRPFTVVSYYITYADEHGHIMDSRTKNHQSPIKVVGGIPVPVL